MNKIYNYSAEQHLVSLETETIDLTVTSPPYDNLRQYNSSFDLDLITKELFRVTKIGGVCVWIVSDETRDFSESGTSFRQALAFMEAGWKLFDTMIWKKSNSIPGPKHRYADSFEYMFVFSKGKPKTFNPIKVKCRTAGKKSDWKSHKGRMKIWNKKGEKRVRRTLDLKIKGNIWEHPVGGVNSSTDKIAFEHPAIFPEKLVRDHILSWSNEGDLVYDCFMGSGTTAKVALLLNRDYLGAEISKEYVQIARQRLSHYKNNLFALVEE